MEKIFEMTGTTLNRYSLNMPSCPYPLDVESFEGLEQMSVLYHYTIRFTSPHPDLTAEMMLSKPVTLSMERGELFNRLPGKVVHGVVTSFRRLNGSRDQVQYEIIIEPFLALLNKQFRSHRFFVNKSVPEVVAQILDEHSLKDWEYEFALKAEYPKREQINQYQESDLDFIERLLAEVGIFYFFTLQPDTQTEVVHFADRQSAWQFGKTLPLSSPSGTNDNGVESVWNVTVHHNVVESSVTASDYNHREAQKVLTSAAADMTRGEGDGVTYGEVYHYRPRHLESGDKIDPAAETGNFWARLEHERYLSSQTTITGSSTDVTLSPAQVLTITELAIPATLPEIVGNGLVILRTGYSASRKNALRVTWSAMPYSEIRCWRPPAKPRPVVSGTLTARVTSAKDNDIYAWQDESGLYRVKFDADRDNKSQGRESMPVRLAKPYGGDKYGFHFPLIQGTEVAIAFHEGDPDRPYIAHALHDSRHVDHVTEKNSTRNVMRTAGLNKLRMEDKRGEEHIKLSTEYGGKTQLNLGHNVNSARELRGEGAELRTDDWVSIRGGKGVFISADGQPQAQGQMLAMDEALCQLQQAQRLTESLYSAAETAKAELADLQTQKILLSDALTALNQSALIFTAPAGIAQTTAKSLQLSAGENLMSTSGKNTDFSVLKAFTVAAGEVVSLFAQKMGMKFFAAKGKVDIQAQGDEMSLEALKDVRISSSEGKVIIRAEQDILLVGSGGAYLRIGNGEVESGAPDKVIQRAAVWQKFNGQSASEMAQKWDKAEYGLTPEVLWPFDNAPAVGLQVEAFSVEGKNQLLTTVAGETALHKSPNADVVNFIVHNKE
ncbi:type IV secretion protein Rhs [Erwinia typographi]|uniref:Type IV secretion protein Rhs n=1 Tax=Erwinia typographi TaxID=371042 RepID=A0A0A3Z969_9GAMM|nr:type VI secretion system Vgr family protein [Erwinia typographi]KGT95612.1 type IV secretion protein Rhs [Erwinia typographi]